MLQSEKEPTGVGAGKSVCHLSCQSGLSAGRSPEADSDVGLELESVEADEDDEEDEADEADEDEEAEEPAGGWAATLPPDELQAPTASAAAASQPSQPSLVIRRPHLLLPGTPSPPLAPLAPVASTISLRIVS